MKYTKFLYLDSFNPPLPPPVLILALLTNAGLFEMLRRQVVMSAAVRQSAAE